MPPRRSAATSTSSIARPIAGRARRKSRSRCPDELADEVARRRDQLLEAAAEADDDVLTKYLEGEEISDAELDACLHRGVRDSILAPVLVGSAAKGIGIAALLDAFVRYLPSPAEEGPVKTADAKSGAEVAVEPDPDGPLVVRVFKTTADPFVGRLSYLRVYSGTLQSQGHVWNANRSEDERIGQLLLLHGKDQEPIGEIKAGEIGAVAKLSVTETGDTLSTKEKALVLPPLIFPKPTLMLAIEPVVQGRPRQDGPGAPTAAGGGADGPARADGRRRAGPRRDGRGAHRGRSSSG